MNNLELRFTRGAASVTGRRASGNLADLAGTTISGRAAVFYNPKDPGTEYLLWSVPGSKCVERIMPTAFDRALREHHDVRCLLNHDSSRILGRTTNGTLVLGKDAQGLVYRCELDATFTAHDVAANIRRGDVTGSSFSFWVEPEGEVWRAEKQPDGSILDIREIHSVSLLADVSPVTFPAYQSATVGMRIGGVGAEAFARAPGKDRWTLERIKKRGEQARQEIIRDYKRRANEVARECAADAHAPIKTPANAGRRERG